MTSRTNIAERLSHVFARLDEQIPGQNNGLPLLGAWRAVLQPPDNDDLVLVSNIGIISSAMLKLESQVDASEKLTSSYKIAVKSIISQLRALLIFSNFNQPASSYKAICSINNYGTLGVVGLALATEFSEPKIGPADAEEIKSALLEIKELLSSSCIPIDLRYDLITQIDQMLWWLRDLDMVSSSDLYEKIGSATFTAKLIADADKTTGGNGVSRNVFDKIAKIATKMISVMSAGTRFVDGISQLDTSVHHLLTLPPP